MSTLASTVKWLRGIKTRYLVGVAAAVPIIWQIDEKLLDNRISKILTSWVTNLISVAGDEWQVPIYALVIVVLAACLVTALLSRIPARLALDEARAEADKTAEDLRQEIARLQKQLGFDDLTKIPNRRQLEEAFQANKKNAKPFCLCYVDIVGFGAINERVDHERANRVLVEFASTVRNDLRGDDELFRLEGDQFALVLCGTGVSGARACVGRIMKLLLDTPCYAGKHPQTEQPMMIPVRCRFGITDCAEEDTLQDCLRRADAALNHAKDKDESGGEGDSAVEIISKIDARNHPDLLSSGYQVRPKVR